MTLATICGIVIFLMIAGFFLVISLVGMMASDSASTKVKDNSVFVIKLNGSIASARPKTTRTSKVSTWKAARRHTTHLLQPNSYAMP